jgi:hypothetical protein
LTISDVQTGLKAREGGGVGDLRPYLEQSTKIRWNGDRQRYERREIVVDRKNDYYRQSWLTVRRASARSTRRDGTPTRRCTGRLLGVGSPSQPPRSPATSRRPRSMGAENPDTASDQRDRRQRTDLALTVVSPAA